jgi:hypothetical protein
MPARTAPGRLRSRPSRVPLSLTCVAALACFGAPSPLATAAPPAPPEPTDPPVAPEPEPAPRTAVSYLVIVHPQVTQQSLDRRLLSDIFLKKTTRWHNGQTIKVVDLEPGSATRARFSEEVIGRSVAAIRSYWQHIIYSGRGLPPPELADDDAVVSYVLRHAGAIGYVSASARLRATRAVAVR